MEQDIRERCATLPIGRAKTRSAVRKGHRQSGFLRQRDDVFVPFVGDDTADGNVFRLGLPRGNQGARPPKSLKHFVTGIGACDLHRQRTNSASYSHFSRKPGRVGARWRDPDNWRQSAKIEDQRSPDRLDEMNTRDGYRPKQRGGPLHPRARFVTKSNRQARGVGEIAAHSTFEERKIADS
jgi:hypothetical protein